ncbi:MAG: OprO/OprP family phosphate-selective porin [Planctomycetes bacterium]|nr:OprO/OprP family phosphate-selective porin [Planctomycetota bacterium]
MRRLVSCMVFCLLYSACAGGTEEALSEQLGALRKEIDALRKERSEQADLRRKVEELQKRQATIGGGPLDLAGKAGAAAEKYGPNAPVTTKTGKLRVNGLVQVWYYTIQNDNLGFFGDLTPGTPGGGDSNETKDNDSFRIRRAELKFTLDLNDYVRGVIMFDPAREAQSFPNFSTNLGTQLRGRTAEISSAVTNVQSGAGGASRMLKDAYVQFHDFVPHHEFTIGQFKPPLGDEGIRSASDLDFAERALITQLVDFRDLGIATRGYWWDDRFQYWLAVFNAPGNFHGSDGGYNDRSDTNDAKDLLARVLLRPLWKDPTWGSIELSWSSQFGIHGEAGNPRDDNDDGDVSDAGESVDGLNRRETWAIRHYAAMSYLPSGPVKGWWMHGEWAWIKDRNAPAAVRGIPQTDAAGIQTSPNPFSVSGWYVSTGYRISDSVWKEKVPGWFRPFEFAYRCETFQNVAVSDLTRPKTRTDVFASTIQTAGVTYYIQGNNAKIQANYMWADEPDAGDGGRGFREVKNDSFVVNFQVAW